MKIRDFIGGITDSVAGVCDTTILVIPHSSIVNATCSPYVNGEFKYMKRWEAITWDSWMIGDTTYTPIITCRRLVCVTIDPHPIKLKDAKCIPCPVIPGQAIIFYEEVKQ